MDKISFLKVNSNIVDQVIDLKVGESQSHLIASNAEWIAQASFNEDSVSYGIYINDKAAGLISLIDPRVLEEFNEHFQKDHLYVWRLMIDHRFQGYGLGKKAVNFSKQYASLIGLQGLSLTTMDKEEGNALSLYQRLGFIPTGRRLDDEIELIFSSDR
ncbi:GNAT family N-acetyltransferase [Vibrio alginolyticus]|uniref:GNAT family N-acetyltransferase n=1 Tax=Vibrio harveyi group TaxID=717610 RepID=UPI001EEC2635|nr:GNAT family N-acetyltransferase [Vibrio alginolyticus]MCG6320515.1 GNAT family N-acetyltransferase [Vibrio alginolyticus]